MTPIASPRPMRRQHGLALIFVLLMMVITLSSALFAARSTLLGDKAARNDRDHQTAFQAAELALNDAELDIMDATLALATGSKARGCKFGNKKAAFYPDINCSADTDRRGFCAIPMQDPDTATPIYKHIDWEETSDNARVYVKYGEFTGRASHFKTGSKPPMPAKPPKYIIVQATPAKVQIVRNKQTFEVEAAYKVYALGYGVNPNTRVMLEAEIYKPVLEKSCGG
ncbi:type IV pilus assembly protein PilX [Oryzisolibacter propanilivorax]|uniref:Type IV pilus assembly protein PilX n=1 Tax=Oryzisolibacter propanilivorax TaxID=1527607 RepID=A0A1G9UTW8_9BURK|nr:PilX N-terminal domain-containing pilus assembly protein [Oryzisolibacter propanilivorax]SDM63352.1 type IV pilus assembly protein PilX [Oryzisolibacter propanilivorax]